MSFISKSLLLSLKQRLTGPLYTMEDKNYALEIATFNTAIVHSPEAVVCATCSTDILETIHFAKTHGYPLSVQSTGHGALEPIKSGLLITTRHMNNVTIDPIKQIATLQAGVRAENIIEAAAPYGLAPILGSSVDVGAVGFLLGGGLGPLARSNGFSSDYIEEMTVVTQKGELLKANKSENTDLFWALRGGKSGLGIVTEVRLRLVKTPNLYAGSLFFEEKDIENALRAWVSWTDTADPQVTTSIAIVCFPEVPHLPEKLRGRRLLNIRFAYPGSTEAGIRLAAPLRTCAPVYIDMLGVLPIAEVGKIHNDPSQPMPFWSCGVPLSHIDQDFISIILNEFGANSNSAFSAVEIRHLGSAASYDVEGGSAVGGRCAQFICGFVGRNPQQHEALFIMQGDELLRQSKPWISAVGNSNLMGKTIPGRYFTNYWPPHIVERLESVRKKYS